MLKITIFVPQNIKLKIMNKITLSNGVEMPQMGYGVFQVIPDECGLSRLLPISRKKAYHSKYSYKIH